MKSACLSPLSDLMPLSTAIRNEQTAFPLGVYFSSGSATNRPISHYNIKHSDSLPRLMIVIFMQFAYSSAGDSCAWGFGCAFLDGRDFLGCEGLLSLLGLCRAFFN